MSRPDRLLPSATACPTPTAQDSRTARALSRVREGNALAAQWRDAGRRRRAEIRMWKGARSLEDLAVLTVSWLRGDLLWHPNGHRGGPDPETLSLVEALAAANAAGCLTLGSATSLAMKAVR
ncbi:DUF6919 domain-containing protein [Streptomyces chartreusis]